MPKVQNIFEVKALTDTLKLKMFELRIDLA